jgi:hypothetical protein
MESGGVQEHCICREHANFIERLKVLGTRDSVSMDPSSHGACTAGCLGIGGRGEVKRLRFIFLHDRERWRVIFVNDVTNGQKYCYRWFVLAPDPVHGFIWNLLPPPPL